ncbi:hypothetical protein ACH37Y_06150 [Sphingomonas paucimobilis]|uniref:hypothetical protein n=1 Tax=Sphingomonas paucimobilis TaxID=13689 RepID=UPI0037B1BC50
MNAQETPDAVREGLSWRLERIIDDGGPLTLSDKAVLREALAALDSRAGDAGEGKASNRVIYLLQGDNSRMAGALRACRDQFSFYASEHTAAGKSEKAATNARFAKIADDALTAVKPTTPAPAVDAVPAGEVERARQIAADTIGVSGSLRDDYLAGIFDSGDHVRIALASLSHGEGRK